MKKQVFLRWFWCLLEYLMVCPIILIIAGFSLPQDSVVPFTLLPLHTLGGGYHIGSEKVQKHSCGRNGIAYTAGFVWLWIALFQVESIAAPCWLLREPLSCSLMESVWLSMAVSANTFTTPWVCLFIWWQFSL